MHSVWDVPELAKMILAQLPKGDLPRILRCSRRDFRLAAPPAWKEINSYHLDRLLHHTASIANKEDAHDRLRLYFPLVQTLSLESWNEKTSERLCHALRQLLVHGFLAPFFPSLRHLRVGKPCSMPGFDLMILVIHATLQTFTLGAPSMMDVMPSERVAPSAERSKLWSSTGIETLANALSAAHLTRFSCDVDDACRGRSGCLPQMFPHFNHLTYLHVSVFPSTKECIAALVALPCLAVLDIDSPDRTRLGPEDIQDLPFFPCLTTLICADVPHRRHLGCALLSRTRTLCKVELTANLPEEDGYDESRYNPMSLMDIQQLSSFIAQSKRTIMHIQLKILREGEYSLTDIAPLYECHEIRSLDLGVGGQLVNTADLQFQRMAQAWPHLRELSVVTEAWRDDAWTVTFEGGELTPVSLDVLHPFALHCPELSEVRITGIGAPPTTYPVLPLQAGVVQASMIHFKLDDLSNDVAKAADVARLLDGLYPDREIRFLGDSRYATRVRKALHKHRRLRLELENAQELE